VNKFIEVLIPKDTTYHMV